MLTIKQIRENFPELTTKEARRHAKLQQYHGDTDKARLNYIRKDVARVKAEKAQPAPTLIRVEILWKKSRTWGYCPTATLQCWGEDGYLGEFKSHASGCGYDKGSTVLADCLNNVLLGRLHKRIRHTRKPAPYGATLTDTGHAYFAGGIGINCYKSIVEWLGGSWHWHDGTLYDYIEIKF